MTAMLAGVLLAATCLCGEAPERANDFFWENDRVGFRAYGPGDPHKWSGIDVFNKATTNNFVVHLLREPGKHGNWHKNVKGLGMDDYAVGPGRGEQATRGELMSRVLKAEVDSKFKEKSDDSL